MLSRYTNESVLLMAVFLVIALIATLIAKLKRSRKKKES